MIKQIKELLNYFFGLFGLMVIKRSTFEVQKEFSNNWYTRLNQRRQEHIESLDLNIIGKSVLEVGAGVGDLSSFWLDRKCDLLITEGREENLKSIRIRFPRQNIQHLDMDNLDGVSLDRQFDIVFCYGLLYHLANPENALSFMSKYCKSMLLLSTCVSFGETEELFPIKEPNDHPTQSMRGMGCRPTRIWVVNCLKRYFDYVYMPLTQPAHPEYPLDWNKKSESLYDRAIFIASKSPIENHLLVSRIPEIQVLSKADFKTVLHF